MRDGAALAGVLPHTASQFARAIVMPDLKPPVTMAAEYRALSWPDRIAFIGSWPDRGDTPQDEFFDTPRLERAREFLARIIH